MLGSLSIPSPRPRPRFTLMRSLQNVNFDSPKSGTDAQVDENDSTRALISRTRYGSYVLKRLAAYMHRFAQSHQRLGHITMTSLDTFHERDHKIVLNGCEEISSLYFHIGDSMLLSAKAELLMADRLDVEVVRPLMAFYADAEEHRRRIEHTYEILKTERMASLSKAREAKAEALKQFEELRETRASAAASYPTKMDRNSGNAMAKWRKRLVHKKQMKTAGAFEQYERLLSATELLLGTNRRSTVALHHELEVMERDRITLSCTAVRAFAELFRQYGDEHTRISSTISEEVIKLDIEKEMSSLRKEFELPDSAIDRQQLVYDLPMSASELIKTLPKNITMIPSAPKEDFSFDKLMGRAEADNCRSDTITCVRCISDFHSDGDPKLLSIKKGDLICVTYPEQLSESSFSTRQRIESNLNTKVADEQQSTQGTQQEVPTEPAWWCGYVVNLRSSRQAWFPSPYVVLVPVDDNIRLLHLLQFRTGVALFQEHLKNEHSSENLNFLNVVNEFMHPAVMTEDINCDSMGSGVEARKIVAEFIVSNAPQMVNLCWQTRHRILAAVDNCDVNVRVCLFEEAAVEVLQMLENDTFPRFKISKLFQRFRQELGQDENVLIDQKLEKYQELEKEKDDCI